MAIKEAMRLNPPAYDCGSTVRATARNRIPLRNCDSSGWIRTTGLTIMSRAL
jgi:hypothetical protein